MRARGVVEIDLIGLEYSRKACLASFQVNGLRHRGKRGLEALLHGGAEVSTIV
jgi:hypothetical protein